MGRLGIWAALALLASGAQVAFASHGHYFVVDGTACTADGVACFDARFEGSGNGRYRLTLSSPAGEPLPALSVEGREQFLNYRSGNAPTCPWLETFDYRGHNEATDGAILDVRGALSMCGNGDHIYHGKLRGHYLAFDLVLPFPHPEPEVL